MGNVRNPMDYFDPNSVNGLYDVIKKREREQQINDILARNVEQGPDTPFVDEQAQFMGQPSPNGLVAKYGDSRLNMQNALMDMYKGGMGTYALQLQQSMQKNPEKWMLGEIGAEGDRRQSVFYNPTNPTQVINAGEPYRKNSTPDWMLPGWFDAQKKAAEAKGEGRMSPTAQKELFEADETTQSASNVISLLSKAKEINKGAMYGPYSEIRAKGLSLLPGENDKANKTIDLNNIMTGQALESLKLIFGGMPTEGERKILLDMQASVDKTPTQREAILNRALELAQRRMEFNKNKAEGLRSGKYFKQPTFISDTSLTGNNAAAPNDTSADKKPKAKLGDKVTIKNKQYVVTKLKADGSIDEVLPEK